jgi:hypothetical protein
MNRPRLSAAVLLVTISGAASACAPVTYGTGTGTGRQTVADIFGIIRLNNEGDCVLYLERPPLTMPPPGATQTLPPPGPVQDPAACPEVGAPAQN